MYENLITRLRQKGLQAHIAGSTLYVDCPFCTLRGTSRDTRQRLGIELHGGKVPKGVGFCFNCKYRSNNALKELIGSSLDLFEGNEPEPEKPETELPEDYERLNKRDDYWAGEAWDYLTKRGMNRGDILRYRVGLSLMGRSAYRIVFPVYDVQGTQVGWTARTIVNAEPKWLHSRGLRSVFWGLRTPNSVDLIVTEGVFDAIAVARAVRKIKVDVLALLGSHVSTPKMQAIATYRRVYLWLDPDSAGRTAMFNVAEELNNLSIQVHLVEVDVDIQLLHKKADPAELTPGQLLKCLRSTKLYTSSMSLGLLPNFVE